MLDFLNVKSMWNQVRRARYAPASCGADKWYIIICVQETFFRLSVSGRCCLDGSSIHRPIFCCSSHSPYTLGPIQSSTPFSQDLFCLPRFFGLGSLFPSSNNFSSVSCPKQLNFCFLITFRSVPDVTPSISELYGLVCSVFSPMNMS